MKEQYEGIYYDLEGTRYSVSEISQITGLSRDNIRYYEKIGLVKSKRENNNYRYYVGSDIEALLKIEQLRGLGFSLNEICRMDLKEWSSINKLLGKLYERRIDLEKEIRSKELEHTRLQVFIKHMHEKQLYLRAPALKYDVVISNISKVLKAGDIGMKDHLVDDRYMYQSMPVFQIFHYKVRNGKYEKTDQFRGQLFTLEEYDIWGNTHEERPVAQYAMCMCYIAKLESISDRDDIIGKLETFCELSGLSPTGELYIVPDSILSGNEPVADVYMPVFQE